MPFPSNVILLLTTVSGEKHTSLLEVPSLGSVTDALIDLYVKVGSDEAVETVKVGFDRSGSRRMAASSDPRQSPEEIAAELWEGMTAPYDPGQG